MEICLGPLGGVGRFGRFWTILGGDRGGLEHQSTRLGGCLGRLFEADFRRFCETVWERAVFGAVWTCKRRKTPCNGGLQKTALIDHLKMMILQQSTYI